MQSQAWVRALCVAVMTLGMAACGGGGDDGFSDDDDGGPDPGGGGTTVTLTDITINLPNGNQLPSDADEFSEGLPVVAIARRGGLTVAGATIEFGATSGELTVTSAVTDSSGRAFAVLTTASNSQPRPITVLASGGGADGTGVVNVVAPIVNATPTPRLGTLNGTTFTAGAIRITQTPLAAGGSSGISLDVVDTSNANAIFTTPVSVSFTSECIRNNRARVNPNPAVSVAGAISATYVASGCSGADVITASTTIGSSSQSASGTISVQPATLGSIEFVSATPINIGLRGAGRQESSTVVFRLRDSSGGPVAGQSVSFALNTTLGDIRLTPATGTTDGSGQVQTVVSSGTVATAVRVTATATQGGNMVSSQSEQLTITTGIPDQDSFSLSAECFNVEGLNRDGVVVPITLRAADRYNNPVPNDTAVTFTTEGGAIQGSCVVSNGACSVNWTSQDPRPRGYNGCVAGAVDDTDANCSIFGTRGAARAGRSTITAFAVGEERFDDADSDGLYDVAALGETVDENGNGILDPGERYEDLGEAFVDWNGNGVRDNGTGAGGTSDIRVPVEPFFDFLPLDGLFSAPDRRFTGLLCDNRTSGSAGRPPSSADLRCSEPRTLHVRDSVTVIMSGSQPLIAESDISVSPASVYNAAARRITINANDVFVLNVALRDVNEQPLAAETDVVFSASGDGGAIQGTGAYQIPCTVNDTLGANTYGIAFKGADIMAGDPNGASSLELRVTSPSGVTILLRFTVITLAPTLGP